MKQLFRGGYPDRATGLGMTSNFANYDGRRDRDDIHLSLNAPFTLFGLRHEIGAGWMSIDDQSDIQQYAMVGPKPAVGSYFNWRQDHIAEPTWSDRKTTADDLRTKQTGAYIVGRFALAEPLHLIAGGRWSDWKTTQNYFGSRREYKVNNQFTPYAGLIYDINKTYTAYASYTEIFQPQNARDTSGSILPPIDGKSYEVGLKAAYLEGRLNASAALFQTRQNNLAQTTPAPACPASPICRPRAPYPAPRSRALTWRPAASSRRAGTSAPATPTSPPGTPTASPSTPAIRAACSSSTPPIACRATCTGSPWAAAWTGRAACTNPPPARAATWTWNKAATRWST